MAVGALFRRRKTPKLPPPMQHDDAKLAEALTIPILEIPQEDAFQPVYTAEEYRKLGKRDRATFDAVAIIELWIVFLLETCVLQNAQIRQLEMENLKLRRETEQLKVSIRDQAGQINEHNWKLSIGKWIATVLGAGLIAALIKMFFDHLGK